MNLKRLAISALIGASALSFCNSASSYTRAMVTCPAQICITSNAAKALIGIKMDGIKDPYEYAIINNMANPITINYLSISIEGSDTIIENTPKAQILPGSQEKLLNLIGESVQRKRIQGILKVEATWAGGKAVIEHPIEIDWDELPGQSNEKEDVEEIPAEEEILENEETSVEYESPSKGESPAEGESLVEDESLAEDETLTENEILTTEESFIEEGIGEENIVQEVQQQTIEQVVNQEGITDDELSTVD